MSAPPPSPPPAPPPSGVDLPTLVVTAIASALAAYICSKVWKPGTLASAAMTPVLVAIGKELLRKPTEVVVTVVPPLPRRRISGPDEPTRTDEPAADLPTPAVVAVQPPAVRTRTGGRREIHWRIAVITGVLGFALCAAVITIPELLTKGSGTTLFGSGSHKVVQNTVTQKTSTVVIPGETVTQTAPTTTTTTPAETATTPATVTTTTTETAPPTVTETVTTPATTPAETTSTDTTATEAADPLP